MADEHAAFEAQARRTLIALARHHDERGTRELGEYRSARPGEIVVTQRYAQRHYANGTLYTRCYEQALFVPK